MRRLLSLAVTIGLRVFLVLTVTAWMVGRSHHVSLSTSHSSINSTNVGVDVAVSEVPILDPLAMGWYYERNPLLDAIAEDRHRGEYAGSGWEFHWGGIRLIVRSWATMGIRVEHGTLIRVALIANLTHWLCHRRKRRAVPCED